MPLAETESSKLEWEPKTLFLENLNFLCWPNILSETYNEVAAMNVGAEYDQEVENRDEFGSLLCIQCN